MSRGWESKDVESQQAEREERASAAKKVRQSEDEIAALRVVEDLQLRRKRVLKDLRDTSNQRYRLMLEESLRFLDAELANVSGSESQPPEE